MTHNDLTLQVQRTKMRREHEGHLYQVYRKQTRLFVSESINGSSSFGALMANPMLWAMRKDTLAQSENENAQLKTPSPNPK